MPLRIRPSGAPTPVPAPVSNGHSSTELDLILLDQLVSEWLLTECSHALQVSVFANNQSTSPEPESASYDNDGNKKAKLLSDDLDTLKLAQELILNGDILEARSLVLNIDNVPQLDLPVELAMHRQQFVELLRSGRRNEALVHASKHMGLNIFAANRDDFDKAQEAFLCLLLPEPQEQKQRYGSYQSTALRSMMEHIWSLRRREELAFILMDDVLAHIDVGDTPLSLLLKYLIGLHNVHYMLCVDSSPCAEIETLMRPYRAPPKSAPSFLFVPSPVPSRGDVFENRKVLAQSLGITLEDAAAALVSNNGDATLALFGELGRLRLNHGRVLNIALEYASSRGLVVASKHLSGLIPDGQLEALKSGESFFQGNDPEAMSIHAQLCDLRQKLAWYGDIEAAFTLIKEIPGALAALESYPLLCFHLGVWLFVVLCAQRCRNDAMCVMRGELGALASRFPECAALLGSVSVALVVPPSLSSSNSSPAPHPVYEGMEPLPELASNVFYALEKSLLPNARTAPERTPRLVTFMQLLLLTHGERVSGIDRFAGPLNITSLKTGAKLRRHPGTMLHKVNFSSAYSGDNLSTVGNTGRVTDNEEDDVEDEEVEDEEVEDDDEYIDDVGVPPSGDEAIVTLMEVMAVDQSTARIMLDFHGGDLASCLNSYLT